jgi:hypothetical protein
MSKALLLIILVCLFLYYCELTKADIMAYTHDSPTYDTDLYLTNLNTGSQTLIGSTGFTNFFSMEYSTSDKRIYAYAGYGGGNQGFYQINTQTAQPTLIRFGGPMMDSLAFAPDGGLYGIAESGLYKINLQNGNETFIGTLPLYECGFAIDNSGRGLALQDWSDSFYEINLSTGAMTYIGETIGGWGECDSMDLGPDGLLYFSDFRWLYSIDPSTLQITDLSECEVGIYSLAITPEPCTILLLCFGIPFSRKLK